MNYERIHNKIITNARSRPLKKERGVRGFEIHHIKPKCMGGLDEENNLVKLTCKEHFIVHHLLMKMYPNHYGLWYALKRMMHSKRNGKVTAVLYQWLKENKPLEIRKPISDETRKKLRKAAKNRPPISDETKAKMRKAALNKPPISATHKANNSKAQKGKKRAQKNGVCKYCKREMDIVNLGKYHNDRCKFK